MAATARPPTYRKLVALQPDAETYASLGETVIAAADGDVTPEAHAAMFKALTLDRTEPRARFYIGLEFAEKGDAKTAIAIWRDLTASAPPDAPWLGMVREEMSAGGAGRRHSAHDRHSPSTRLTCCRLTEGAVPRRAPARHPAAPPRRRRSAPDGSRGTPPGRRRTASPPNSAR